MKKVKSILPRAALLLLVFTVVCGLLYTLAITGIAQLFFPRQANGSVIEVDGKRYGSALLGQQYTDDGHLWGRIMQLDVQTYQDADGTPLLYAVPANLSPASEEYAQLVAQRVARLRAANPERGDTPIPVDLVTCSGSGLDPHISPAAAEYQVPRVARASGRSEEEVRQIIAESTEGRFLGLFGEERVNVLAVNLRLDGILQ